MCPSRVYFWQSVSSGSSMVGLMVTSCKRAYAIPRSAASRAPAPVAGHCCTSIGDTQTLKGRSGSVSVESPGAHKVLFEPPECLGWVWGLILNALLPLLPSCWDMYTLLYLKWVTKNYCITHGILVNVMCQPECKGGLGENGYMYVYS